MQTRDTSSDNPVDMIEWSQSWESVEKQLKFRFPSDDAWLRAFHICYAHWKKYRQVIVSVDSPEKYKVVYQER